MEGRFMKFLPLTGPDYLPRIVIVQEPEKRSNCCSVFWDWAIKVIGSVVATAGLGWILWYGLAWAMEKSDQDTALANWNALANYIKYCEGLSKVSTLHFEAIMLFGELTVHRLQGMNGVSKR